MDPKRQIRKELLNIVLTVDSAVGSSRILSVLLCKFLGEFFWILAMCEYSQNSFLFFFASRRNRLRFLYKSENCYRFTAQRYLLKSNPFVLKRKRCFCKIRLGRTGCIGKVLQTIMSKIRVDRNTHHLYWNDASLHWKTKNKIKYFIIFF